MVSILLGVIAVIAATVVAVLWWYGVLPPRPIVHDFIDHQMVLLKDYQGPLEKLPEVWSTFISELKPHFSPKTCRMFEIYFDNSQRLFDPSLTRSAQGIILDTEEQKRKAQEIISMHKDKFRIVVIPKSMALSITVPHRNKLGFMFMGQHIKRLYKKHYAEGLKLHDGTPLMMTMDWRTDGSGTFTNHIQLPLENIDTLKMSKFPTPPGLDLSN